MDTSIQDGQQKHQHGNERSHQDEVHGFLTHPWLSPPVAVPQTKTRDGWQCQRCHSYQNTNTSGRADYAYFYLMGLRPADRHVISIEAKASERRNRHFNAAAWEPHQREWMRNWQQMTQAQGWVWLQIGADAPIHHSKFDRLIQKYWKLSPKLTEKYGYPVRVQVEGTDRLPRRVFLIPADEFETMCEYAREAVGNENFYYGRYDGMKNNQQALTARLTLEGLLAEYEMQWHSHGVWFPSQSHIFWSVYYGQQQQQNRAEETFFRFAHSRGWQEGQPFDPGDALALPNFHVIR